MDDIRVYNRILNTVQSESIRLEAVPEPEAAVRLGTAAIGLTGLRPRRVKG